MSDYLDVEAAYKKLKRSRDKGEITEAQFTGSAAELRLQGADGLWYQLNPANGKWLKWDGKEWHIVSDWFTPMRDIVRPLIVKAADDYAKEHKIEPRSCK